MTRVCGVYIQTLIHTIVLLYIYTPSDIYIVVKDLSIRY